jgi:hypothetical protein
MIVGLGGVGMAALITAVSQGVSRIVAVDTLDEKLEHARRLGAHETYAPQQVLEEGVRARYVIECAGNPRAFETAFAATAVGGTTITAGLPHPEARAQISPLTITAEARTIVGATLARSAVPGHSKYAQLWRKELPVELISARIALADINRPWTNGRRESGARSSVRRRPQPRAPGCSPPAAAIRGKATKAAQQGETPTVVQPRECDNPVTSALNEHYSFIPPRQRQATRPPQPPKDAGQPLLRRDVERFSF